MQLPATDDRPSPSRSFYHSLSLNRVGCRVSGAGCRVQGAGCRVQGAGCRVQGAGCRV